MGRWMEGSNEGEGESQKGGREEEMSKDEERDIWRREM